MSIARAIQHLDRYAQKDLRALTARVLEPALRALPEAFENDSEDALALREAFDANERECARVSSSAKDVFAFAASSGASDARAEDMRAVGDGYEPRVVRSTRSTRSTRATRDRRRTGVAE